MAVIRDIFPENLRYLMRDYPSVSQFSRDLDIERTKLNRYLSGQSAPRPEELKKICDHFRISADVLFVPLTGEDRQSAEQSISREITQKICEGDYALTPRHLPSGLYQAWRHSSAQPGKIRCILLRVFRRDGATLSRFFDPWASYGYSEAYKSRMQREGTGILLAQNKGFCEIRFTKGSSLLVMTCYHFGYKSNQHIFPGAYVTTQSEIRQMPVGREFIEYLGRDTRRLLGAARQAGYHDYQDCPRHVQELLGPDPIVA